MQSGGEAAGNGKDPPPPPPPSSAPAHPGFESIQQQPLIYRQLIHQSQLSRKAEGEATLLVYQSGGLQGVVGGSNFGSSSGAISLSQPPPGKFGDPLHQHGAPRLREENQNKGQGAGQHVQNPAHQAYLQCVFQADQQKSHGNMPAQQQMVGPSRRGGPDMLANNLRMQDLVALQAANQTPAQNFAHIEKQTEQGNTSADQRSDPRPPQAVVGQANMIRPVQLLPSTTSMQSPVNSQLAMAQLQALLTWAREHNLDPSQVLPLWQSARMVGMLKPNETSTVPHQSYMPPLKQQLMSSPAGSENSAHANSSSDLSGPAGPVKSHQTHPSGSRPSSGANTAVNSNNIQMLQHQLTAHTRENQNDKVGRHPSAIGNGVPVMHLPQSSGAQSLGHSDAKNASAATETLQMQHFKPSQQLTQPLSQPAIPSRETVSNQIPSQGGTAQMPHQRIGFMKQQLHVLKAQILAFKRLKRGDRALPEEVLRAIAPPPLDLQLQQPFLPSGMVNQERAAVNNGEEHGRHAETIGNAPQLAPSSKGHDLPKDEPFTGEEKAAIICQIQGALGSSKEPVHMESVGKVEQSSSDSLNSELDVESGSRKIPSKVDLNSDEGNAVPMHSATLDAGQVKKSAPSSSTIVSKDVITRKYHGPLFDFPSFTRKHDPLGSINANYSINLTLAYDVNDLLFEEGMDVLNKKRTENLKKISSLLAVNLERKRIRPDLVLRMQIEEKKLGLFDLQARLRDEVDQQQQEIMMMSDRPYRKFVRECERQRVEFTRQVQQLQKHSREKQLKSIFQWRKKLLEALWAIRDARITRNRGVAKYHERMLREFSKRKDGDRNKRMEALKNNDVDKYREMLLEQQTNVPGDAAQQYAVLSSFLSQTEEYLHKLGGKITATKNHQELEEAANAAAAAARSQGLSEEEVKAAAACAREEVMIRNRFSEMNAPKDSSSVNKYYNLAHAVNERVVRQPSMLRAGTLRDYQLVGLQWMLSLYNNKLNGILADEMGLGKTVQVMALLAYLMEFKGNYGPHLIIVPNAVLVNWKSELFNWLPSMSCVFYVGGKDQRSKLFSQVRAVKFNVLVTTYEFVMYDRSKLSKVEWKYIIIDEAQRMKDRESVLARDLDRYRCQRRLLLTGTPLQNDLRELWSLLNLLLPEVFDNSKAFHDWFSKPFQKDGPSHSPEEDDWLETEKKVIIIHRLHQILEPFMLRRRVEDVEGSLPPKVSVVLRCRMSAIQSAIYDWIKSTGTIRVDPEEELRRAEKNPMYQVKMYKNLHNKCMELRKVCNHPLLSYPYFNDYSKDFIVRSCGKLWILDRILIKLQRAGHRVLLFSTMTKLLDILEEYLQWRRLVYRRIDGTTSLEDRESAIMDFNSPDSDCFIFLLSIRAAGRGLNLQTADTVVIYDPDPNPQNEEQAVARAHRIGQKREVKVIYMEAVVEKISSYQKEDELRNGGTGDSEDDLAGKDRYVGSIESLIRSNIQQYKIGMADEVINAGRFDQRTTHEERRMTLETLLHDEERYQETVHDVPSLQEVNRLIARSEEEIELFDQMDEDFDWTGEMVKFNQVPKWLRAGSREVNAVAANTSKKPAKNILAGNIGMDSGEILSGLSPSKSERRRGRPKGSTTSKKYPIYRELDDDGEDSDASSERNTSLLHEEEVEIGDFEDEESNGAIDVVPNNKDQLEEEGLVSDGGGFDLSRVMEGSRGVHLFAEAGSAGSSAGSRRFPQPASPMSAQKFGSLSALDARPGPLSEMMPNELEEGEIAVSGDSHMDLQPSGSCIHDLDDGEDEQVLQPKLKRKRSIRVRPRYTVERLEEKSSSERVFFHCGSQLPLHGAHDYDMQSRTDPELEAFSESVSDGHDMNASSLKQRRSLALRKVSPVMRKSGRLSYLSEFAADATEHSRGSWNGKALSTGAPSFLGTKMSDSTQRKCKNVISKLQRRIDKDGRQIIPILYDLRKRNENSSLASPVAMTSNLLDLQRIELSVDSLEYNDATDFIADVQLMLENAVRQCNYSYEVRNEAGKLQDLFFDIMKIAFPDTEFLEAKKAVTFSGPGGAATAPSPKQSSVSRSKRRTPINEVEPDSGQTTSKLQKESTPASVSARDQVLPECSPHFGDLVICKKRRNDRDKSAVKQRLGPMSLSDSGWAAPVLPPSASRSVGVPFQKDLHPTQQAMHPAGRAQRPTQQPGTAAVGSFGVGEVRWAKPVKRMRTDIGKRRPSHL